MPPKYNKNDYVKVLATHFDNRNVDKAGRNFSKHWLDEGNGRWCYGTISRVYVKKGRQAKKYGIKFDGGQSMPALEDQIEPANDDEEGKEEEQKERDGMYSSDRDSDNESTDYDEGNIRSREEAREGGVTDEDEGIADG
jgi:hypothetical protein